MPERYWSLLAAFSPCILTTSCLVVLLARSAWRARVARRRLTAPREVFVFMFNGEVVKRVWVRRVDEGWAGKVYDKEWLVLKPGGKIVGYRYANRWLPVSGWGHDKVMWPDELRER